MALAPWVAGRMARHHLLPPWTSSRVIPPTIRATSWATLRVYGHANRWLSVGTGPSAHPDRDQQPSPSASRPHTNTAAAARVWTVPNLMTMARLALAPVVGWALMTGAYPAAIGTLAVAGGLDFLDGWVARRFHQTSILGTFLDPLADKVLLACTAVPLALTGLLHPALVTVVVGRDALLLLGSFAYRARTKPAGEGFFSLTNVDFEVQPTTLSKMNTALQIGLVAAAIAHGAWSWPPDWLLTATSAAVVATTIGSGFQYLTGAGFAKMKAALPTRSEVAQRLGNAMRTPTTAASGDGDGTRSSPHHAASAREGGQQPQRR